MERRVSRHHANSGTKGNTMKAWDTDFDKRFNRMSRFVTWFISSIFVLILCLLIGVGVLTYKAVTVAGEQDWSAGIKPVIERLWCGKPGCLGNAQQESTGD